MTKVDGCQIYTLRIDGPLLRQQRQWLLKLNPPAKDGRDLSDGIIALLDEIADQAHDKHGIDCLLEPEG